jgi:DNA-binding NtrC family response regulator
MPRQFNILLVDDDLHVRQALGEALSEENYQVALAADGPEAVRQLQQTGERGIDAVLLDLRLGLENGWTLLSHFNRLRPGLPVIVMTGTRGEQVPLCARECAALMEKPLDLHRLFETLRIVTARHEVTHHRLGSTRLESEDRSAA